LPPEELKVDVVLSNPPYVTPEDPLEPEVRDFEPALALFAPPGDPLYFYRRILEWADRLEARQLGLECHRAHAEATAQLAREFGWDSTASVDQFGAPRWVWGLKTRA
jgi:release factor glutamine methyltransferase